MSGSNTSRTRPPPYNDPSGNGSATRLKECFANLVKDQLDIQELFKSVAGKLETTPQIGECHTLCEEWNKLRQSHRKVYRDSQHNAGQCASFLNNYVEVIVPLSQSRLPLKDKKLMIMKFIEAITAHQDRARKSAAKFHEIGKQVEIFQLKIASALRGQAEPSGFFQSVWSGFEEICMSIWQALYKLLKAIVDSFHSMLARIRTIRFFCGIRVDIEFERYCQVSSETHEIPTKVTAQKFKEELKELSDKLSMFEEAWHTVRLCCSDLLTTVAMANSLTSVPAACDKHLESAGVVYAPLIECLRAYSMGRSPDV